MSKYYIHANFGQNQDIGSADIEHNITFWSKLSVSVCSDLEIRSRSQSPNQFSFIDKCYIHAYFSSNLLSCSGNIEHNITFWSKFSVFLSAVTLKISSMSQSPNQFSFINKCYIHADFSSNLLSCSGDIEHNITFWSKFSVFLSAVTLKTKSRSQSPNQFSFIDIVIYMQISVQIYLVVLVILSIILLFGLNLACCCLQ